MEGLGINAQLLLAQLINFGLIFWLLVWLLRKPLEKILRERSELIEKSVKEAQEITQRLKSVDEEKASIMAAARTQADELIEKGQQISADVQKKATETARVQADEIIAQAHLTTEKEKERLMQDLAEEIRQTVRTSLEQSFTELSADEQRRAADAAIAELLKR
jgi:F-type H+-transporting ATPase subunit b